MVGPPHLLSHECLPGSGIDVTEEDYDKIYCDPVHLLSVGMAGVGNKKHLQNGHVA